MKKILLYFLVISLSMVGFTACETYDDMEVEYSPIFPISGEWVLTGIYDATADTLMSDLGYTVTTYNTNANTSTEMWIRLTSTGAPTSRFIGKVACNVSEKSFAGSSVTNGYVTNGSSKFTVTNGLVELDGYTTNTGGITDKISFVLTTDMKPGMTFRVEGFRRTGWEEDE